MTKRSFLLLDVLLLDIAAGAALATGRAALGAVLLLAGLAALGGWWLLGPRTRRAVVSR